RAGLKEQKDSEDLLDRTSEDVFEVDDVLQSPAPSSTISYPQQTGFRRQKEMKQMQFEEQINKAMMHSQRELAKATSAQVDVMQQQLEVALKKVAILEAHQKSQ
ncbi:hypothetical protein JG688_00017409, partial [Phytophthora aleatoria]